MKRWMLLRMACGQRSTPIGPESVAIYGSGQLLTEDYYAANKLMKGYIGTANIDTNSRLCMASAVVAHNRAFGEDVVPVSYDDIDAAELIILVGSNTAWCHPDHLAADRSRASGKWHETGRHRSAPDGDSGGGGPASGDCAGWGHGVVQRGSTGDAGAGSAG